MQVDRHPINVLNKRGAPQFITTDAEELRRLAKERFEVETGRTLSPSQVEMYLINTAAFLLSVRGNEEQRAFERSLLAYCVGDELDEKGVDLQMPRLVAVGAKITLRFERVASADRLQVPRGTRTGTGDDSPVQFATLADIWFEAGQGSAEVEAQAVPAGVDGNDIAIGAVATLIDPVPGVTAVTNTTASAGGADRENDDHYRVRLALSPERIGDGLTKERYVSDVFGWSARVIDVAVLRPEPNHVDIYPLLESGVPSSADLASLLAMFSKSNTHQGDFITAKAPTALDFTFTLALQVSDPTAPERANAAVQAVLDQWRKSLGQYVAPSELIAAAKAVDGVVEADIPDLAFAAVASTAWRNCNGFTTTVAVL